jgi:nitroreductase
VDSATADTVLDTIHTCRAMRRFKQRAVPEREVRALLDAAIRAPSGGNAQNWRFVVVRDPAVKHALGEEVRRGTRWKQVVNRLDRKARRERGELTPEAEERAARSDAAFGELARNYEEVPVLICVCVVPDTSTVKAAFSWPSLQSAIAEHGLVGTLRFSLAGRRLADQAMWSAGYAAVQNILLAARAKGLGAVLTAPHFLSPPGRVERILALPKGVRLAAVIPVGYPLGHFGPVRRRPLDDFIFYDQYGRPTADNHQR